MKNIILGSFIVLALVGMLIAKAIRYGEAQGACDRSSGVLVSAPNDSFLCLKREAVQP